MTIIHLTTCLSIANKIKKVFGGHSGLLSSAFFMYTYKELFTLKELRKSSFRTHRVKVGEETSLQTEDDKMAYAENLVKEYAQADFVVTSRIHCALPCVGLETPVLFTIWKGLLEENSTARFGGLIDFLHIAKIVGIKITERPNFDGDIFSLKNKQTYKSFAESLYKKCTDFVQNDDV